MNHLKHVGIGMWNHADANKGKLPHADKWYDAIRDLTGIKGDGVLQCPATNKNFGYAMNKKLSGVDLSKLAHPAETVLAYETTELERNASGSGDNVAFRHDGGAVYLFVDGHVRRFGKDEKPSFDVTVAKKTKGIGKTVSGEQTKEATQR
jgi:prepilin-type processing-associated H-X9-DG protein